MSKNVKASTESLRIIRFPEVKSRIGYCQYHLRRLEAKGEFPRRVKIGARSVGWVESEIDEWIATRVAKRSEAGLVGGSINVAA
ncbi:prophage regulatory protein [Azospirillum agricola]|uniref:helix-turn-helix transcriptional regulator n=1 Tax=Azospirillum agricola TaxID=1720247 RepID=UPI001AEB7174|nr:prophage regulatory protein [Azospirillum agricola]